MSARGFRLSHRGAADHQTVARSREGYVKQPTMLAKRTVIRLVAQLRGYRAVFGFRQRPDRRA
jgi:hypothetical protein